MSKAYKTLFLATALTAILWGCSKGDQPPKVEPPKQSEELIRRINDSMEVCNSMKSELDKMKRKIDANSEPANISEYNYKMKLPELYLRSSTEYLAVCGVFNQK